MHIGYRLIDKADPEANPNLDFLLADAAHTIATLREEEHCVLVHCVAAQSRTPTVAIAYDMHRGTEREWRTGQSVLLSQPQSRFPVPVPPSSASNRHL